MLAPHQAEHHQLGIGRRPADQDRDPGELVVSEPELAMQRDAHARTRAGKRPSPSVAPSRRSTASSGCGINPRTLPCALATPAAEAIEPSGFSMPYVNTMRASAGS